jgi:hypothetical protein
MGALETQVKRPEAKLHAGEALKRSHNTHQGVTLKHFLRSFHFISLFSVQVYLVSNQETLEEKQ